MQEMDRQAAEVYGLSTLALMENAGRAVAVRAQSILGGAAERRVVVVCGSGNNGGDGLVAARHLANRGARVRVVLAAEGAAGSPRMTPETRANLQVIRQSGLEVLALDQAGRRRLELAVGVADLVVDAVLGTGARGAPRGMALAAIELIRASGRPVLAVDIPSGVDADSGAVPGACVTAVETLTFGLPKPGHLLEPGALFCGRVVVADIGFPAPLTAAAPAAFELMEAPWVARVLPERPAFSHKGTFGHVLLVAGSRGMTGAGALAARAAVAAGAGLVTWALPASVQGTGAALVPEALTYALADGGEGYLTQQAASQVQALLAERDVLVLGPGLGVQEPTQAAVVALVEALTRPAVIDADGLNILSRHPQVLEARSAGAKAGTGPPPLVLTPHPGEMARLVGSDVPSVQRERVEVARQVARRFGAVVVLKGARTVVAAPDGRVSLNPAASAALATGGSGDVLAGVIGAFLAQGVAPFEAACAGTFVHALAGLLAANGSSLAPGAGEIARSVPEAIRRLKAKDPMPEALAPVQPLD